MLDFVPKGTGNSRSLKSAISAGTTWEQALEMLRNGTFPIDIGAVNDAGVAQKGSPINKTTLLQDATASLFKLSGETALPDRVFEILSKAALVGEGGGIFTIPGSPVSQLKVESGTYVGTGATNASLTFSAKPDVLFISGSASGSYDQSICIPYGSTGIFDGNALFINFSWNGNTVSWTYGNNDAGYGLNKKGRTYYYAALVMG